MAEKMVEKLAAMMVDWMVGRTDAWMVDLWVAQLAN